MGSNCGIGRRVIVSTNDSPTAIKRGAVSMSSVWSLYGYLVKKYGNKCAQNQLGMHILLVYIRKYVPSRMRKVTVSFTDLGTPQGKALITLCETDEE